MKREGRQFEHGKDDGENPRPGLKAQQSDSGDQSGERKHQDDDGYRGADQAQYSTRERAIGAAGVGKVHQAGQAAENRHHDQRRQHAKPAQNNVQNRQNLDMLLHGFSLE